jgi:hypothetical protein
MLFSSLQHSDVGTSLSFHCTFIKFLDFQTLLANKKGAHFHRLSFRPTLALLVPGSLPSIRSSLFPLFTGFLALHKVIAWQTCQIQSFLPCFLQQCAFTLWLRHLSIFMNCLQQSLQWNFFHSPCANHAEDRNHFQSAQFYYILCGVSLHIFSTGQHLVSLHTFLFPRPIDHSIANGFTPHFLVWGHLASLHSFSDHHFVSPHSFSLRCPLQGYHSGY